MMNTVNTDPIVQHILPYKY